MRKANRWKSGFYLSELPITCQSFQSLSLQKCCDLSICHSCEGRYPSYCPEWIPAFAGMTRKSLSCFVYNVVTNPDSLKRLKVELWILLILTAYCLPILLITIFAEMLRPLYLSYLPPPARGYTMAGIHLSAQSGFPPARSLPSRRWGNDTQKAQT